MPTPVEIVTGGNDVAVVDGASFGGLKVVQKPNDYGALGHYSITGISGVIAAGATANTQVFTLRNTSATNLICVQEITIPGMFASTAFAVGAIQLDAYVARAFTSAGTPGQTALTLTTNNAKTRTSMGTTSVAAITIANTATIGDPTWTLDAQPFARILTHSSGGVGAATPIIGSIFLPTTRLFQAADSQHPIVLAQNEGIALMQTVPATGVWKFAINVKWFETLAF